MTSLVPCIYRSSPTAMARSSSSLPPFRHDIYIKKKKLGYRTTFRPPSKNYPHYHINPSQKLKRRRPFTPKALLLLLVPSHLIPAPFSTPKGRKMVQGLFLKSSPTEEEKAANPLEPAPPPAPAPPPTTPPSPPSSIWLRRRRLKEEVDRCTATSQAQIRLARWWRR